MGYVSDAQRKAVHASKADGGKGNPNKMKKSSALKKISAACKAAAKRKCKVWPSAYASGWGVRCTRAGGPSRFGGGKKKKKYCAGKVIKENLAQLVLVKVVALKLHPLLNVKTLLLELARSQKVVEEDYTPTKIQKIL